MKLSLCWSWIELLTGYMLFVHIFNNGLPAVYLAWLFICATFEISISPVQTKQYKKKDKNK